MYENLTCVNECPSGYFKLEKLCINKCDGILINNRSTFLTDKNDRNCNYCDLECKGCIGPVCKLNLFVK